jgi:two-component system nitrate/nitrite sensor histidine kinase NarX
MERDAAIVTEVPAERQCASVGGFRTVGVFPVRYRHRLVGMCNLWFDTPRVIEERERKLIAVLGQHLGAALEAERLRSREKELAVSEERNLLAQELHDSIAQSLAFLNLQAQMLDAALVKGDIEEARAELAQIRAGVQESYDDVRELLTHFRTRMAELDLSGALRQAVSRFGGADGYRHRVRRERRGNRSSARDAAPDPARRARVPVERTQALGGEARHGAARAWRAVPLRRTRRRARVRPRRSG